MSDNTLTSMSNIDINMIQRDSNTVIEGLWQNKTSTPTKNKIKKITIKKILILFHIVLNSFFS